MKFEGTTGKMVGSGLPPLDDLLRGLRLGDNVVWQVDRLEDYSYFTESFASQAIRDGLDCVYLRFAPHAPINKLQQGLNCLEIDPGPGFDYFSGEVHRIIESRGKGVCYIFDNLSVLVNDWATDESLANFFQVTCPFLWKMDTVAYFALTRGRHSLNTVARIRDTTQILLNVYHVNERLYVHPLKVFERYSAQMFLPHLVQENNWLPISQSGDAAIISAIAHRHPISSSSDSIAPWNRVYEKLKSYQGVISRFPLKTQEIDNLKADLLRMIIGNHQKLSDLASQYFNLEDLSGIRDRLIGTGQIGGKAVGMLLARKVLTSENIKPDFKQVLEEHDSFYIGSDVFFTFLVNNDLFWLRLELTKKAHLSLAEFGGIEQRFSEGLFPDEILEQFRDMLAYYGQAPIIIRSSSLLEDSFKAAFAGKYRSEFLANQGDPDNRLEAFLKAIKIVYASTLNPDALSYRQKKGLTEGDEKMAILVQRVSGNPYKSYFFPSLAGVAFSRNLYAWTDRIDPNKGMIRLVFGLGTHAVNRVAGDYTRMIGISHPQLRPESEKQVSKYSQRNIDLIDLKENTFSTKPVTDVLSGVDFPNLPLLVSSTADGYLQDPIFSIPKGTEKSLALTFNNLINRTDFILIMGELLSKLETVWECPIDIEFTAYLDHNGNIKINLLQCRALRLPAASPAVDLPFNISAKQLLFRSNHAISAGAVDNISNIIYIDPKKYTELPESDKRALGRIVGKLNDCLSKEPGKFILMGPGRWGSNNIDLGINVSYADISNSAVLVEIAYEKAGHEPEVSYGTHFFLDLVEAEIIYLPVYPDDDSSNFNIEFFDESPNTLSALLPEYVHFSDIVRVIEVPKVANGASAHVVADLQTRSAICFLQ
jgi:pyruvate, water dikinase